ncbi:MAG: AsmA-like C-terminal region-containing protein, partial [Bacteroidota bacterium]|nr:AsmA-like C-terminal region-containing protein [Bacteroidota bacterium]
WPGFSAKLVVQNGEIRHPELKASITGINLHLLVENKLGLPDSTNFLIKDFRMMLDDNPVSGYLLVYGTSRPYIKADIKTNTNIEELEKLFKIDSIVAKGNLSLDVEAEGYLDFEKKKFPVLDTKINLTNGYYESPSFPVPFKNIHFVADISNTSGDFKDTKIRIDTLTYAVEDEPFVVKGTIENMNDYTFDIEANGLLDFEKLSKIFPIENTKLSGKVISNIKANGKVSDITSKNYEAINVKGMAIVKNFHYSNPEFNHRLDVKDAIFNFSPEKIRVDKFSGIIGNSTISTKGEVSHYLPFFLANKGILEVNFDIICDSLNLNEWLLQPHKKDTSTEITVYKIPENLNVDIKSQIGRIIFDKLEIDDLKGNIIVKDGVLKIKETGFSTLGSPFKLSMTYDTRDMDSPKFDIEELYIKDLELNKAYNAFYTVQESAPAAQHTNGVFSITYKLKGELKPDMKPNMKSLKGGGIVFIKSAQVNGMRMFDHISSLTKKDELKNPSLQNLMLVSEISKGRLIIKPFKFKVNKYDAELEGFHDFEGTMAYVMKIGIPPFEKAKIPIHIEGEYSKPNIKLGKGHSLDSLKRR